MELVIARNPDPDLRLPYLIRVPLGDGLVFRAGGTWPRTSAIYCYPVGPDAWPDDADVVERVPVRSCVRRGAAIDLVLARSREVVGWATGDHLRTDLIDQALTNAVTSRRPARGVIFHSDRGQYTSAQYRRLADQHGVRLSVGRRGQCWDNAVAESFFATIKTELLDPRPWPTRTAAHKAMFNWIEGWYNTRRRHSTLDYLSPAADEARLDQQPGLRQVA